MSAPPSQPQSKLGLIGTILSGISIARRTPEMLKSIYELYKSTREISSAADRVLIIREGVVPLVSSMGDHGELGAIPEELSQAAGVLDAESTLYVFHCVPGRWQMLTYLLVACFCLKAYKLGTVMQSR